MAFFNINLFNIFFFLYYRKFCFGYDEQDVTFYFIGNML